MEKPEKLSPMYEQYLSIKKEYPDGFLFYRMGDFYELFFDDAVEVAKELQLTLTARSKDSNIPMAGVPHHALENYASQLIDRGFTLVICDQIEDPKTAKGLVKRAVTRIITPGTVIEPNNLEAKEHNYLGAYFHNSETQNYAFAWLDVSTGDWTGFQSNKESEVTQWVLKIAPRELLLADNTSVPPFVRAVENVRKTFLPVRSHFDKKKALELLKKVQQVQDAASLGIENFPELTRCLGALVLYLEQTQKQSINYLKEFRPLQPKKYMLIDEVTEKNLELFVRLDGKKGQGTLASALDETLSPVGGRLLNQRIRQPFAELERILYQQELVTFFSQNTAIRQALREELKNFYDIERLSTKIHLNRALPKDIKALADALKLLPAIYDIFHKIKLGNDNYTFPETPDSECSTPLEENKDNKFSYFPKMLLDILNSWDSMTDVSSYLSSAINDELPQTISEGKIFRKGFNSELDHYIQLMENNDILLNNELEKEQKSCDLPKLKLGYNRVFGYYYELSKVNKPSILPTHFQIKQTLGNAERYATAELKKLEVEILSASDAAKTLETKLFQELRDRLCSIRSRLMFMADAVAQLDLSQSFAQTACKNSWSCPSIDNSIDLKIIDGRHPVIEPLIGRTNFVPNSLTFDTNKRLLLITGPNMAGKSTILRQTAIIVLLAQMGAYVPAQKATIGISDRIFSRVGASDNLLRGQSTFMVEMMETARILRQSTKKSLIILDEIGRGTSTYDGLSLAFAIVEDLTKKQAQSPRSLFATHYHELTSLEGKQYGVYTTNVAIREWQGEIVFLRKLVPGPTDKSYGIEVAKLAGIPLPVVQRARFILQSLEQYRVENSKSLSPLLESKQDLLTLPGIDLPKIEEEQLENPFFEADQKQEHPLVEILLDLEPDEISPMQAFNMIHEWKKLWGMKNSSSST